MENVMDVKMKIRADENRNEKMIEDFKLTLNTFRRFVDIYG